MIQPHLKGKFEKEVRENRNYKTPGTPRFKIQRASEDMDVLDPASQKKDRSGVGMLFYLTKYSRPGISNVVRELSKCMDGATWGAYHDLISVIKFVIDTKTFGLNVEPRIEDQMNWSLNFFCSSDWAGDPKTRISVTGFIVYLLNVPIFWCSKAQRSVTLSSCEAEYVAISEAVKEIKFIYFLLEDIHVEFKFPIILKTDNVGEIFTSEKASTGVRTRHVDTRYHFVREFIENGLI